MNNNKKRDRGEDENKSFCTNNEIQSAGKNCMVALWHILGTTTTTTSVCDCDLRLLNCFNNFNVYFHFLWAEDSEATNKNICDRLAMISRSFSMQSSINKRVRFVTRRTPNSNHIMNGSVRCCR